MSIEAGLVINTYGEPIYWHLPSGRSATRIPDSRELWDVLWHNRQRLAGFAHSHPGSGMPSPSHTDLTTFLAIEQALGKRLQWWITSSERLIRCMRYGEHSPKYSSIVIAKEPSWAAELRQVSCPVLSPSLVPTRSSL